MKSAEKIDAIAAVWVSRDDRRPLDPHERAELEAWLAEDPRHKGAYVRAQAVFLHLTRVSVLSHGRGEGLVQGASILPDRHRRRLLGAFGIAATLAGIAMLPSVRRGGQVARRHESLLGEVRRIPLEDGSVVTLNSRTVVSVEYSPGHRNIRLLQGEALFDVAKAPNRPFVVHASGKTVTAIGTSFTVRHDDDGLFRVLVRRGIVDVGVPEMTPVRLTSHNLAVARSRAALEVLPVNDDKLTRELAWQDGMLSFNGDTLEYAAEEFGRYSPVRIVIGDEALGKSQVMGLYASNDASGFARAVAVSMGLELHATDGVIRLSYPRSGRRQSE